MRYFIRDSWDDHRGGNRQGRGYYRGGLPRGYRGRGRGHGRGRGSDFNNPNDKRSPDSQPQGSQSSQTSQAQSKEEKRVDPLSGPIGQWQAPAVVDNWEMEISPKSKTESWLASTDSDKPSEALGVAIGQWEPPTPTSSDQDELPVENKDIQPVLTETRPRKMADGGVDQWPASTGQVWNGTSSHTDKPSSRKENELRLSHLPEPSGFSSPTSPGSLSTTSLPTPTHIDWATCGADSGEADYGMWKPPEEESAFSYNYHPSEADSCQQSKPCKADSSIPPTAGSGSEADGQTKQSDNGPQFDCEPLNTSESELIAKSSLNDQSNIQVSNPVAPSQDASQDECEDTEADQAAESGSGDMEGTSERTLIPSETPAKDAPESESAEGDESDQWTAESAVADSHDAPEAETAEDNKSLPTTDSGTKEE
ncbi:uncharacterized protein LOC129265192 [Lytechinus pictus]|uniref:uncharacterized protein LOC129265192 n=1 Tax=Lytechinus pictus TaxID=7653 RepID=UPI0030B9F36B